MDDTIFGTERHDCDLPCCVDSRGGDSRPPSDRDSSVTVPVAGARETTTNPIAIRQNNAPPATTKTQPIRPNAYPITAELAAVIQQKTENFHAPSPSIARISADAAARGRGLADHPGAPAHSASGQGASGSHAGRGDRGAGAQRPALACTACHGEGREIRSRYGGNDPDQWVVGPCEFCNGTGDELCHDCGKFPATHAVPGRRALFLLCDACFVEWRNDEMEAA